MEPFLEAHSKRPIRSPIHIQEGQAKVIAIRKDGISNSDIFLKVTPYFNVYPYHVTRFDPHKKIFDVLKKLDKVYDMNVVLSQTFMIEENNVIFFQLSPIAPGVAIVEARFVNSPQKAYSEPVEVTVSHVSKKL